MDWNEPKSNKKGAGASQPLYNPIKSGGGYRPGKDDMDAAKLYVVNNFSDFLLQKIFDLKFEDRHMFCLAIGLIPSLLATGFAQRFAIENGKDAAAAGLQMMTLLEITNHIENLFDTCSESERNEMRSIIKKHNEITKAGAGMISIVFNEDSLTDEAVAQRNKIRNSPDKGEGLLEEIIKDQPEEIREAILATKKMSHDDWARKYGHLAVKIATIVKGLRKK